MPEVMGNAWLPTWLRVAATAGFAVVLAVHLRHLADGTRRRRAWHSGHVLTALGMIDMFLPTNQMIVATPAGEAVFAVAATAVVGFLLAERGHGRRVGGLWPVIGVDLAAMAYMFAMLAVPSTRLGWLTGLLIAWFVLQALGWLTGKLAVLADLGEPRTAPNLAPTGTPARRRGAGAGLAIRIADGGRTTPAAVARGSARSLGVRATLAVMSLGMAYMFLAGQLGPSPMARQLSPGPMAGAGRDMSGVPGTPRHVVPQVVPAVP